MVVVMVVSQSISTLLAILFLALTIISLARSFKLGTFDQSLDVYPLEQGGAHLVQFHFNQTFERSQDQVLYSTTFPLPIITFLDRYFVNDRDPSVPTGIANSHSSATINISLSKGRWDLRSWGAMPIDSFGGGHIPLGSMIEVSLDNLFMNKLTPQMLRHLSGLLSINFASAGSIINEDGRHLLAIKSDEPFCLENINPVIMMMPCSAEAGLLNLLRPAHRIFDTQHHSMLLSMKRETLQAEQVIIRYQFNVSISVVFNQARRALPLITGDFSERITALFPSSSIGPACRLSELSHLSPPQLTLHNDPLPSVPLLVSQRSLGLGWIQQGLQLLWTNQLESESLDVHHLLVFPTAHMDVFLSQLQSDPLIMSNAIIRSSVDGDMHRISMSFTLAPQSTAVMVVPFRLRLLPITEFPPAQYRGFLLHTNMCFYQTHQTESVSSFKHILRHWNRIIPSPISYKPPVPDATMPYNVITLVSTLLALCFGTIFNLSYRRFYLGPSPLRQRLNALFVRLFRRSQ